MRNNKDIINAWKLAERDLGIKVNSEFTLNLRNGGKTFLLIEGFGSPNGTIATSLDDTTDFKELDELGFYCSALGDSYSIYDRALFIDTLDDWGFFGDTNKQPTWYSGRSWD